MTEPVTQAPNLLMQSRSANEKNQKVWDPFRTNVAPVTDIYYPLYQEWTTKGLVKLFSGFACFALWFVGGAANHFGFTSTLWYHSFFMMGMGLIFWCVPDVPEDTSRNATAGYEDRWRKVFVALAKSRNWPLRLIHPSVTAAIMKPKGDARPDLSEGREAIVSSFKSARRDLVLPESQIVKMLQQEFNTTNQTAPYEVLDPDLFPLMDQYPHLITPGIMVSVPFRVQGVFWHSFGDLPLWTAIGVAEGDMRGFKGHVSRDADKATLYLVVACPLERDTQISAQLSARVPVVGGRGTTKLDGELFNDLYAVEMLEGSEVKLYQTLTPAAQTYLLDLFEEYGVELHIDRRTLFIRFIAGTTIGPDEDPAVTARRLQTVLTNVASSLPRLKTYLE